MTVINGNTLLSLAPIKDMIGTKQTEHGVSYGLSEAGFDIRIKQQIEFIPANYHVTGSLVRPAYTRVDGLLYEQGNFTLASAIEEFQMPNNLVGIVHDKSTWARQGLSVFNTVIEPNWNGFLTLELVFHRNEYLLIPAGSGIAQVIFHEVKEPAEYSGKYQNQSNEPVESIFQDRSEIMKIVDEKGVYPSRLDKIVEEQKQYYQPDQTKRGFTPK